MLVTERTFAACAERVSKADDLVVDLETTGLLPWKGDRLCGIAVEPGDGGEPMYFSYRHEGGGNLSDGPERLLEALAPRTSRTFRGWHLRYDLTMLAHEPGGATFLRDAVAQDAIVTALLLNENEPSFSLEAIAAKYLGTTAAGTKVSMEALLRERFPGVRKKKELKGNLWRLPASDVEPYACGDVVMPRLLAEKFAPAVTAWGLDEIEQEMNGYGLLLARMQTTGIRIDRARCAELSETTESRQAALLAELQAEIGDPKFNPGSWQHVVRVLGTENAQEVTLKRSGHPLGQRIIDYKKLGKAKSTYYDKILGLLDADDMLHPQLNLTRDPRDVGGTRTSRLSCSGPNFQALPHADDDPNAIYKVRDLLIPRPGCKIAKLDYQRAEMWMGAVYANEQAIQRAYHQNRDLYIEMAAACGITRQQAKILFLMIQYGAGAWKIAQVYGWPFRTIAQLEAEFGPTYTWGDKEWIAYKSQRPVQVKSTFFELYPGIKAAMDAYTAYFEQHGCLRLWTGRVIHYDPATTPAYAAWNRVIQGAVGEMIRLAMMRLEPMLAQYDARMILQVHDELVLEYPAAAERQVLKIAKFVMEDFDFALRPRVEISTSGQSYAAMQSWAYAA